MRHIALYGSAFLAAIVFYLLQQLLRTSFYPVVRPPLSGAGLDALFTLIYGLCAFVMLGATTDFLWRAYARRRFRKQRMTPALKTIPKTRPRPASTPKTNVFR